MRLRELLPENSLVSFSNTNSLTLSYLCLGYGIGLCYFLGYIYKMIIGKRRLKQIKLLLVSPTLERISLLTYLVMLPLIVILICIVDNV